MRTARALFTGLADYIIIILVLALTARAVVYDL